MVTVLLLSTEILKVDSFTVTIIPGRAQGSLSLGSCEFSIRIWYYLHFLCSTFFH